MTKQTLGFIFIAAGLAYGTMAIDSVYNKTLGYLLEHDFIKQPEAKYGRPALLGRKGTIALYSFILIILGIFLIWNSKT